MEYNNGYYQKEREKHLLEINIFKKISKIALRMEILEQYNFDNNRRGYTKYGKEEEKIKSEIKDLQKLKKESEDKKRKKKNDFKWTNEDEFYYKAIKIRLDDEKRYFEERFDNKFILQDLSLKVINLINHIEQHGQVSFINKWCIIHMCIYLRLVVLFGKIVDIFGRKNINWNRTFATRSRVIITDPNNYVTVNNRNYVNELIEESSSRFTFNNKPNPNTTQYEHFSSNVYSVGAPAKMKQKKPYSPLIISENDTLDSELKLRKILRTRPEDQIESYSYLDVYGNEKRYYIFEYGVWREKFFINQIQNGMIVQKLPIKKVSKKFESIKESLELKQIELKNVIDDMSLPNQMQEITKVSKEVSILFDKLNILSKQSEPKVSDYRDFIYRNNPKQLSSIDERVGYVKNYILGENSIDLVVEKDDYAKYPWRFYTQWIFGSNPIHFGRKSNVFVFHQSSDKSIFVDRFIRLPKNIITYSYYIFERMSDMVSSYISLKKRLKRKQKSNIANVYVHNNVMNLFESKTPFETKVDKNREDEKISLGEYDDKSGRRILSSIK